MKRLLSFIVRLRLCIKIGMCQHEFRLADMKKTGIEPPPQPPFSAPLAEHRKWAQQTICGDHPFHTERIAWPCFKCGKEFRAHCGIDILQHGKIDNR